MRLKFPIFSIFCLCAFLIADRVHAAPVEKKTPSRPATLIGDANQLGWSIALGANYASIRSNDGLLIGGKGGIILDHHLVLGAAGYGFLSHAFGSTSGAISDLAYGGAYAEYIFLPQELLHFSASTVVGAGSANNTSVFVWNPALNGIVNLSPTVHLGAEIAYRFVSALQTNQPNTNLFSGASFGLFVQFGQF